MGYCVDMEHCSVTIPAEKVAGALGAINALHTDENLTHLAGGGMFGSNAATLPTREIRWYSWVTNPPEDGFRTLKEAFEAWRYAASVNKDGAVAVDYFSGEKWGDDELFWRTLAPFIAPGSEIEFRGEDGLRWRYLFAGGCLVEQTAQTHWV